jgi:hypothetical protein
MLVYCFINTFAFSVVTSPLAFVILSEAKNLVFRLLQDFIPRNDSVKKLLETVHIIVTRNAFLIIKNLMLTKKPYIF